MTEVTSEVTAIPMVLYCPKCGHQHIDEGEYAKKPHRSHLCESCKCVWRPADVFTVGVEDTETHGKMDRMNPVRASSARRYAGMDDLPNRPRRPPPNPFDPRDYSGEEGGLEVFVFFLGVVCTLAVIGLIHVFGIR